MAERWPCPARPLSEDSCVVRLFPCLIMFFSFPQRRLKIDPAGRAVAYVLVRRLVRLQGPSRRLQEVRLFLRAFVLYSPWITGEHRQGASAVECVAAHLRGFEEDSRSEVVFWIEEWSIEFGFAVSSSRNKCC